MSDEKGMKYWSDNGKYQADYEALNEALVPAEGTSDYSRGELLRVVANCYYDVYNNGVGGNESRYTDLSHELDKWDSELGKQFKGAKKAVVAVQEWLESVISCAKYDAPYDEENPDEALDLLVDATVLLCKKWWENRKSVK